MDDNSKDNDSDNDIENLQRVKSKRFTNDNEDDTLIDRNERRKNEKKKDSMDFKSQTNETYYYIKIFIIALLVSFLLFILNIILGVYVWKTKKTFFGKIFFAMGLFSLIVAIFNLISVIMFKRKFDPFTQTSQKSGTDIEILQEGESYENLQKSNESSLMNLGMYLLMFIVLVYFIFAISSLAFYPQVVVEMNSYANDKTKWEKIFKKSSYSDIKYSLISFIISFGVLSLITLGYASYIFYISFSILGFFRIYQKVVQFTSMLYLQLGIVFLYLSISLTWFKNISLIESNFISWLPVSLIVSSLIVIIVSLIGYVGATRKDIPLLIATCVITALFIGMFIVFAVCSIISTRSLLKFSDNKCPILIDYFNENYVRDNLICEKYIFTSEYLQELNCPKERIVTAWEKEMNLPLVNPLKSFKYGCINISCCYQIYNLVKSFTNYISIISICLIIFGLLLIGTSIYLIYLLQRKFPVDADEKTSQYFVYCFVGAITLLFIILLARNKVPKYSPSFSNEFKEAEVSNVNNDFIFNPFSIIKKSSVMVKRVEDENLQRIIKDSIIEEDFSNCPSPSACNSLYYQAEIKSNYKISVNEDYARDNLIDYEYGLGKEELFVRGDLSISKHIYNLISFTDELNPNLCLMEPIIANVKIIASSNKISSKVKNSQKLNLIQLKKEKEKDVVKLKKKKDTGENVHYIDMSQIELDKTYIIYKHEFDFSYISKETQKFTGRVMKVNKDNELEPLKNTEVIFAFKNFLNCKSFKANTDLYGNFISPPIPIMSNLIRNEITLSIEENIEMEILSGGIGYLQTNHLGDVILQDNLPEGHESQRHKSFSSTIIDAIEVKPIQNANIFLYEGNIYFPNLNINTTKYSSDSINNEFLISSINSLSDGTFLFNNILSKEVYTLLITKEGYYEKVINYYNNNENEIPISISLTPVVTKIDQYRIELDWPNSPYDINIFSYFRNSENDQCEVFFGNKRCQNVILNNENYNNGTQGSQVITIEKMGNYIYTFAVRKFILNDDPIERYEIKAKGAQGEAPKDVKPEYMRPIKGINMEANIIESKAKVRIYTLGYRREIYNIDIGSYNGKSPGSWWVLFCLKGNNGISSIKSVNELYASEPNYALCEGIFSENNNEE